jgi:ornithine cyclodeaminase
VRRLDADEVLRLLDLDTAYASQVAAFRALGEGAADLAERLILAGGDGDATAFCYAARLRPGTGAVCKFGAVGADNASLGLPAVSATVLVLDAHTGVPVALLDGDAITERRTAAATAVAVDVLAHPDAQTLAVLGCGLQGRAHLAALRHARSYREVRLWDRTPGRAAELARDGAVAAVGEVRECVAGADVVVCCTSSPAPVLDAAWLSSGCTIVSIGSYAADLSEVGVDVVQRADHVVVDHRDTSLRQSGPIVAAVRDGLVSPGELVELGDLVANGRGLRNGRDEIVFYTSVGIGVQDAAAALAVLERT